MGRARDVHSGGHHLSKTQLDAFEDYWADELSQKEICAKYGIVTGTLRNWTKLPAWTAAWTAREEARAAFMAHQYKKDLEIARKAVRDLAQGKGKKSRMNPKNLQIIAGAPEPVAYPDQIRALQLLLRMAEIGGGLGNKGEDKSTGGALTDALLGRAASAPDGVTEEEISGETA